MEKVREPTLQWGRKGRFSTKSFGQQKGHPFIHHAAAQVCPETDSLLLLNLRRDFAVVLAYEPTLRGWPKCQKPLEKWVP